MTQFEIVDDPRSLDAAALDAWDRLAEANGLAMSAPSFMLGWWRHLRPPGARMRIVLVREGRQILGVAPFFVVPPRTRAGRVDYRLLGSGSGEELSPLSLPGHEWRVASCFAQALDRSDPRPDLISFEATPLRAIWAQTMRERWPKIARPSLARPTISGAPRISLAFASFEEWLTTLDQKTRAEARRRRRRMTEAGGTIRWSTSETMRGDLETLFDLHERRWEGRAASGLTPLRERAIPFFLELGKSLLGSGRMRIQVIELGGEPICAHVMLSCGGAAVSLNGGWDERHKSLSPPMVRTLAMIEDGIARGERHLSLGNGELSDKLRFADGIEPLAWDELTVPGPRRPLTLARRLPHRATQAARSIAKRAMADGHLERLRSLGRNLRRPPSR